MFKGKVSKLLCRPQNLSVGGKTGWGSLVADCLCTLTSVLCFAWSGIHMLTDEFPEMAASGGGQIPLTGLTVILAVTVLLFTLPGRRFEACRRALLGLTPFLGVLAAWRIGDKYGEEILSGSLQAVGIVTAAVNRHYKFNFVFPEGQIRYCPLAVLCIGGFLLTALLYIAFAFRRRWIVMGFPLVILNLGLLAGCAPGISGITECFIGLLFCQAGGWESAQTARGNAETGSGHARLWTGRRLSLAALILLAVFLPLGISVRFTEDARDLAESGEGVVVLQRKVEEALELNIQQLSFTSEDAAKENINNRTPKYREQEALRVILAEKPERTLYFRGFYGGKYAGGGWNSNRSILRESLAGQEWTEEDVARWLCRRAGAVGESAREWEGFSEDCTLHFGRRGGTVYAPCFLIPEDPDGSLQYGGEYQIKKKKSVDTVHFGRGTEEQTEWEDEMAEWYAGYVRENYCSGSEAVPSAGRIAEELLAAYVGSYSTVLGEWPSYLDGSDFPGSVLTESLASTDAGTANQARLHFAHAVSAYLSSGLYSQELDQVPDGTDVVEYFLSGSQKGYCVHYASAGVLILQAMGIPARYASGYVASASAFENEAGQYALSLKDSAAHAWVEIYLEDMGWVPVEMTPGYGEEQTDRREEEMMATRPDLTFRRLPESGEEREESGPSTDGALSEASEDSELSADGVQPGDTASAEGAEPSADRTETGSSGTSEAPHTADSVDESGLPGATDGDILAKMEQSTGPLGRSVFLAAVLMGAMVAVLVVLLRLFTVKKQRKVQLLLGDIRRKRNRQAVLRMNRSMYRRMRVKNRQWFVQMSDEEYRQMLVRTFPAVTREEWDAFIRIARKANFSRSPISDEEVQTVFGIYKKN